MTDLTPVDYLDMILRKTCAYTTILPLRVGAMIGSQGSADLTAIAQFGFAVGAAFQIQDDLLDLRTSTPHGNDVLGDIREGKRTLMVIHFLRQRGPRSRARRRLSRACRAKSYSAEDVRAIYEAIGDAGSVAFAEEYAARLVRKRTSAFDDAFAGCVPSPALEFLRDVVPFMTERTG